MHEYLRHLESEHFPSLTDVVVIRPPKKVARDQVLKLAARLAAVGFLPILLPWPTGDRWVEDELRWWPTNRFRQVGNWLVSDGGYELSHVLTYLQGLFGDEAASIVRERIVQVTGLFGGEYVYQSQKKVLVYDQNMVFEEYNSNKWRQEALDFFYLLQNDGWRLIPLDFDEVYLSNKPVGDIDLDILLSLFLGKDGEVHALAAESFVRMVEGLFEIHPIPDKEVLNGGCNVADLRGGRVLVIPNSHDVPLAHKVLRKHAKADHLIEGPKNWFEGGGGLRCSISSFLLA